MLERTSTLRAYHSDPKIKAEYLARVRAHRAADELVRGQYWEEGYEDGIYRGCAVGCTIHSSDHTAYEDELGISQALARLEDRFFETMPYHDAMAWPERFLEAIPVDADLALVVPRFVLWLFDEEGFHAGQYAPPHHVAASRDVGRQIAQLYCRFLAGDDLTSEECEQVQNPIVSIATTYAAAVADPECRAYGTAFTLVKLAADVTDAAIRYATPYRSRQDVCLCMAEELLRLLASAPVSVGQEGMVAPCPSAPA